MGHQPAEQVGGRGSRSQPPGGAIENGPADRLGAAPLAIDPLADDPALAPLIERHERLEVEPAEDPFRHLVTAVVNQQLSTSSAATIRSRLFESVEMSSWSRGIFVPLSVVWAHRPAWDRGGDMTVDEFRSGTGHGTAAAAGASPEDPALADACSWLVDHEVDRRGDWARKGVETDP